MKEADYEEVRAELERIGTKARAELADSAPKPAVVEAGIARR
jgi:hypothetical protein